MPHNWPTEPESLTSTRAYDIGMNLYDVFLCALPTILIIKTSLCIVAQRIDGQLNEYTIDFVSPLTTALLFVNEQVSLATSKKYLHS